MFCGVSVGSDVYSGGSSRFFSNLGRQLPPALPLNTLPARGQLFLCDGQYVGGCVFDSYHIIMWLSPHYVSPVFSPLTLPWTFVRGSYWVQVWVCTVVEHHNNISVCKLPTFVTYSQYLWIWLKVLCIFRVEITIGWKSFSQWTHRTNRRQSKKSE